MIRTSAVLDRAPHHRKSESGSALFGGKESLKDLFLIIGSDPGSVVDHFEQ